VPIKAGNEVIGAVGVSGAPGGEKDEVCANAGIAKVARLWDDAVRARVPLAGAGCGSRHDRRMPAISFGRRASKPATASLWLWDFRHRSGTGAKTTICDGNHSECGHDVRLDTAA
jgi:hypothetical protein